MQGYGAGKSSHRIALDGDVGHRGAVVGTGTGTLLRQPGALRRQAVVVRPDGLLVRSLCA